MAKSRKRPRCVTNPCKVLPDGAQLRVTNVIVAGDMAVVDLVSDATARNGMRFDNHYCWVTRLGERLPRLDDGHRAVPPEPSVSA